MAEQSGVFVFKDEHSIVSMKPAEFATEANFQTLLSKFPELLVGDQIDPESPRKFILIKREQTIKTGEDGAESWSIDHLFLDQDAVPTLVEIKRQSDTRIRREVVGQMLDYAANCSTYWTTEMLQASFELTCGGSSDTALSELIGLDKSAQDFWDDVGKNLQTGRIRLLFVADVIPIQLRRIVEFLNKQMHPAEILAVELRQFAGEGLRTIVPRVFGQFETAKKRPQGISAASWTEARLMEKLEARNKPEELECARKIIDWMKTTGRPLVFGTGTEHGSVYPNFRVNGTRINPAYLSTDGRLWLQFKPLIGKPVFGPNEMRLALLRKFNEVDGVNLTDADASEYKSISLSTIAADPNGITKVLNALNWMRDQIDAWPQTKAS